MENQMFARGEREQAIKGYAVDRGRFHEVPKSDWQRIMRQIEDRFIDKSKDYRNELHWANMGGYRHTMPVLFFPVDG